MMISPESRVSLSLEFRTSFTLYFVSSHQLDSHAPTLFPFNFFLSKATRIDTCTALHDYILRVYKCLYYFDWS